MEKDTPENKKFGQEFIVVFVESQRAWGSVQLPVQEEGRGADARSSSS